MVFGFGQVYILTPYHFVNTYTFIHLLPIFPLVAKSKKSRFFLFWTGSTSMGKSAKLEKRAAVIALAKAGHDAAFIHNLTGYNKQFVYEWFARAQKGEPMEDRPRAGRPSKLTRAAKNYILQSTIGKRRRSTRVVARDLKNQGLASVGYRTVGRSLRKSGAHPFHPTTVPKLSPQHQEQRYQFSVKYRNHPWEYTFFVDEKIFQLYSNPNKKNDVVWAFDKNQVPGYEKKRWSPSVHVWGGISMRGTTPLVSIVGSLNGATYRQLLEDHYVPATQELYEDDYPWLLQDKATPHTSHLVVDWLESEGLNYIPPEDWPSNSPDLNPAENIWGWIQDRINQTKIRTGAGLEKFISEKWGSLTPKFLAPYVLSMDQRLKLCREGRGAAIKMY